MPLFILNWRKDMAFKDFQRSNSSAQVEKMVKQKIMMVDEHQVYDNLRLILFQGKRLLSLSLSLF